MGGGRGLPVLLRRQRARASRRACVAPCTGGSHRQPSARVAMAQRPWRRDARRRPGERGVVTRAAAATAAMPCGLVRTGRSNRTGPSTARRGLAESPSRPSRESLKTPSRAELRVALNKTKSLNIGSCYNLVV